jgi:serine/threonine-protein kinase RsbT
MNQPREGELRIGSESDIVTARQLVRNAAGALGFGVTDVTRNIYHYAGSGVMRWRLLTAGAGVGIELTFEDSGPGIPDVAKAMESGFSTSKGLGLGLPGAKRLMDEMTIQSELGKGTTVRVRKWLRTQHVATAANGGSIP